MKLLEKYNLLMTHVLFYAADIIAFLCLPRGIQNAQKLSLKSNLALHCFTI